MILPSSKSRSDIIDLESPRFILVAAMLDSRKPNEYAGVRQKCPWCVSKFPNALGLQRKLEGKNKKESTHI
jgi:hypothetical protein